MTPHSEQDEESLRRICLGIEEAVPGTFIDVGLMRLLANDSFMVPITFNARFGDPLQATDWFQKQGFRLQGHRNGGKAESYVLTLLVPLSAVRVENRAVRFSWWVLMIAALCLCVWTTFELVEKSGVQAPFNLKVMFELVEKAPFNFKVM